MFTLAFQLNIQYETAKKIRVSLGDCCSSPCEADDFFYFFHFSITKIFHVYQTAVSRIFCLLKNIYFQNKLINVHIIIMHKQHSLTSERPFMVKTSE